jgi:antitoxin StbD
LILLFLLLSVVADNSPLAILNHNVPVAYLIPAETYRWLMDKLDDVKLSQLVTDRMRDKKNAIEVNIDDL